MQGKIADMYSTCRPAALMSMPVAKACDRGEVTRKDSAGAILYAAEKATWMALEAIQRWAAMAISTNPPGRPVARRQGLRNRRWTSESAGMLIAGNYCGDPLSMMRPLFASGSSGRGPGLAQSSLSFDKIPGKLPKEVVPSAYRIDMPRISKADHGRQRRDRYFGGQAHRYITLDAIDINFDKVTLKDGGGVATVTVDAEAQTATFHFAHRFRPEPYAAIPIAASFRKPGRLFTTDYNAADGAKRRMLVSQFEATERKARFPELDEAGLRPP